MWEGPLRPDESPHKGASHIRLRWLQPNHYGIDVPSSKWKTGEAFRFAAVEKNMRFFCLLCLAVLAVSNATAADPAAELASFSVFNNVNVADLAKGEPKVAHGPALSGSFISAQSCFVV